MAHRLDGLNRLTQIFFIKFNKMLRRISEKHSNQPNLCCMLSCMVLNNKTTHNIERKPFGWVLLGYHLSKVAIICSA